ncbi:type II toxin-antitoxin system VapC family toxin [Thiorhodovibrio frisius]|uniref:Ribonuclease VapC n=1 Tax=Thiorhodovibrio frisius TaxID=631362 RepID=H8Z4R9_9GAMM|nr:type II toxin-antitoxin system VapC family toxin [Thiorhodovibrio frisius]EIC20326.1 putative nucleic acid-binding protein [Thiorhodovibrio frisius]WPL21064.1 tRNA(fMet)-specific endonuclease VapC [Thiorhodovibrio frisius]
MIWMLDTNTCSFVIRRRPASVKERFEQVGDQNLAISVIVLAEMRFGAELHPTRSEAILEDIEDFRRRLRVLPWSEAAARCYASLRVHLQRSGTPIGNMDLLIAAHAVAEDAVLVTNNTGEFKRVSELRLEDWLPQCSEGSARRGS